MRRSLAFLHSRSAHTHFGDVHAHYEHERLVPDEWASERSQVRPVFAHLHRPPEVHHWLGLWDTRCKCFIMTTFGASGLVSRWRSIENGDVSRQLRRKKIWSVFAR